ARLLEAVVEEVPVERVAGHFHDTRGTALANAARSLDFGVRVLDASAGGLGGCPYAPGAAGNLATEDLVYFLERSGYETGVNLEGVYRAARTLFERLGRTSKSRVHQALESTHARSAHN
ncbi:MAG: hydroxymethylglutaryl-CoA lyase, partial [Armatimonadetes bacterium]|nr:hydroxymethylglutaryl-CoA lyase [Armatimonadota bacterium]